MNFLSRSFAMQLIRSKICSPYTQLEHDICYWMPFIFRNSRLDYNQCVLRTHILCIKWISLLLDFFCCKIFREHLKASNWKCTRSIRGFSLSLWVGGGWTTENREKKMYYKYILKFCWIKILIDRTVWYESRLM